MYKQPATNGNHTKNPAPALVLEKDGADYKLQIGSRQYQIKGLECISLNRLKVTLKLTVNNPQPSFHIDSLDLYHARGRLGFIEGACSELNLDRECIATDLQSLIVLLDAERVRLVQTGGDSKTNEVPPMTQKEKDEAFSALKNPRLIPNLLTDLETMGVIAEEKAKLLVYLATLSRLLPDPLGVLIISRSGAGKTTLQEAICSLVPEESLEQYTRITGQTLFYREEHSLCHKVLAIEEEDGMESAIYAIRTLQSSQKLKVATTRTDPKTGRLCAQESIVRGPVAILISSTNDESMDQETRNRFVIITIDETDEHTLRILQARQNDYTLEGRKRRRQRQKLLRKNQNMKRLLRPLEVVNNYAPFLEYPFDRLQMRREFKKYMTLIDSVAILHQHQKPVKHYLSDDGKKIEYIEVTPQDIALANELVLEFFPNATDELAPHTRKFAEEISRYIKDKDGSTAFTRKQIREFSGWSDWNIRKALEQLEKLEYIRKISGVNGSLMQYSVIDDATLDRRRLLLTNPKELEKRLHAAQASSRKAVFG